MQTLLAAPARLTEFYEIHYILNESKEVLVVEKANMSELDSWLCMLIFLSPKHDPFDIRLIGNVTEAQIAASKKGLSCVRWNKVGKFDRRRASIFFYGDTLAEGLFLKITENKRFDV
ncbi:MULTISPECIES: hypothetical protein [Pseudomonas]|uniref:hypothetical protein n=1 Tax=Pseudomonas TaxID=286 RepID=UPI0025808ACD|nr:MULTISPECIES: hypothetical protein [Pseudomonas]